LSAATLERNLLKELDVRLAPAGFRRVRINDFYGDPYSREISGMRHILGIGTRPYDEGLEASVGSACVRYDAVEDLVAKFEDPHPLVGPEDIAARSTLTVQTDSSPPQRGDPLYSWGGTDRKLWLIHEADEVPGVASEMAAYALEKCEPIFANLSKADQALTLLSGDYERVRSYAGPDDISAKKAIALAFLLNGEAAARQLAKVKLARLKGEGRSEVQRWLDRFLRAEGKSGATKSEPG
jgi:hypothetical protein